MKQVELQFMKQLELSNFPFDDFSFTPYLMIASVFDVPISPIGRQDFTYFSDDNFSIVCNSNLLSTKKDVNGNIDKVVFFRGYISDLDIDQNSTLDEVLSKERELSRVNLSGIYTLIIYSSTEQTINVYTDALGFSPLYTRENTGLLLSNIAGCISFEEDDIDLLALRSSLSNGYIPNNRTLIKDISRSQEGKNLKLTKPYKCELIKNCELPQSAPDIDINDESIEKCSKIFQERMAEISKKDKIALPLSSGWDSRRILAALVKNGKKPDCYSSEVMNEAGIDVDARHAKELADYYKLNHCIIKRKFIAKEPNQARLLRILFSHESSEHIWAYSLFEKIPKQNYIIDGIGGDALGNSGFGNVNLYKNNKHKKINDIITNSKTDFLFKNKAWPKKSDLKSEISNHIKKYEENDTAPELVFLSLHTRRKTAFWGQSISSPLSVIIAPYLNLDYIAYMLRINPKQKYTEWMQRKVLEKEAPETIKIKSSRDYNEIKKCENFYKETLDEESHYIKNLINSLPITNWIKSKIIRKIDIVIIIAYGKTSIISSRFNWRYRKIIEFLNWWALEKPKIKIVEKNNE